MYGMCMVWLWYGYGIGLWYGYGMVMVWSCMVKVWLWYGYSMGSLRKAFCEHPRGQPCVCYECIIYNLGKHISEQAAKRQFSVFCHERMPFTHTHTHTHTHTPCFVMLCHAMSCHVMSCQGMSCYVML